TKRGGHIYILIKELPSNGLLFNQTKQNDEKNNLRTCGKSEEQEIAKMDEFKEPITKILTKELNKEKLEKIKSNKLPDYNREMANDICDYLIGQRNLSHSEQNAERLLRPQRIRQFTTYFECKDPDCGYREKEFIKISKREKRIRPIIEEMVKCLLEDEEDIETLPLVNFPELAGDSGGICAG
ncbi:6186_t:CDS:2, partial [Entrophospora sp. SA101]